VQGSSNLTYPAVEVQGSSNLTYPAVEVQGSPVLFALVRWRRRGLGGDAPWPGGAAPRGAGLTLCAVGATGHRPPVARGASVVSPPVARKSDRLTLYGRKKCMCEVCALFVSRESS
jgi:hypothetical protein